MTSRAGKDLVSCLVSGLLTIGPRFGGAIDDAARYFQDACDRNLDPDEFVEEMKKKGIRVPGIGHRIKSKVWHSEGKRLSHYEGQALPVEGLHLVNLRGRGLHFMGKTLDKQEDGLLLHFMLLEDLVESLGIGLEHVEGEKFEGNAVGASPFVTMVR